MRTKNKKDELTAYFFIFEDGKGNELTRLKYWVFSKKDAMNLRKHLMATSMLNDLKRILIKKF